MSSGTTNGGINLSPRFGYDMSQKDKVNGIKVNARMCKKDGLGSKEEKNSPNSAIPWF